MQGNPGFPLTSNEKSPPHFALQALGVAASFGQIHFWVPETFFRGACKVKVQARHARRGVSGHLRFNLNSQVYLMNILHENGGWGVAGNSGVSNNLHT